MTQEYEIYKTQKSVTAEEILDMKARLAQYKNDISSESLKLGASASYLKNNWDTGIQEQIKEPEKKLLKALSLLRKYTIANCVADWAKVATQTFETKGHEDLAQRAKIVRDMALQRAEASNKASQAFIEAIPQF